MPSPSLSLSLPSLPVERLELENVLVTSQSFLGRDGDERPREKVSLNFTKVTFFHILPDERTGYTAYDLALNKVTTGSDGSESDSDGDGMPDAWEQQYGLVVGTNDASGDADGDGLSNLDEFQLGTHPKSGTSFFKATLAPMAATPGSYQLTWNSVAGKTYIVEWSPDLVTPFAPVRTVTATGTTSTETVASGGAAVGFYRVRPQ